MKKAFSLSFLIYLVPVALPTEGSSLPLFFGQYVFLVLSKLSGIPTLMFFEIPAILGTHLAAYFVFDAYFRSNKLNRLFLVIPLLFVPYIIFGGHQSYGYLGLMTHEWKNRPRVPVQRENLSLEKLCDLSETYIPNQTHAMDLSLEATGKTFIVYRNGRLIRPGLLDLKTCKPEQINTHNGTVYSLEPFVSASGNTLLIDMPGSVGMDGKLFLYGSREKAVTIKTKPNNNEMGLSPILSNDGQYVAWIDTDLSKSYIAIQPVNGDQIQRIELNTPSPKEYRLLALDMKARQVLIRKESSLKKIGLDGKVISELVPSGVDLKNFYGVIWVGDKNWVAWQRLNYKEPILLKWDLPGGKGSYQGGANTIMEVGVDTSGRFIAVNARPAQGSETMSKNSVFILRASDGQEIFRKNVDGRTWLNFAFGASDSFAVGGAYYEAKVGTEVYKLPSM